jgi:Ca2+-binding EF-hand superfamily protein
VLHDAVGTPYTVAPEIILGSYDEKGDVWAIGVITYLLFTGETPFGGACGEDLHQVRENILNGVCKFEPEYLWENVSDLGKDFVKTLLNVDPNDRPTAKDAQRHPWIQTWAKKEGPEEKTLNPKVIDALVSFKELSDMQKLLSEVLSFTLLPEQIEDLRREFEKIDTDGDGEIMFSELKQVLMGSAGSGSLGALSEEEIEDIFQALRVSKDKDDLSIHWHEFIAAGLSQCKVDDRNLRLAFDRLDVAEKGYITLNDIISLMGSNGNNEKEAVTEMWMDCLRDIGSSHQQITFDDFLVLMKGQSDELIRRASSVRQSRFGTVNFASIPEEMPSPEIGKKALRVPRTPYRKQRSRSLGEQETTPWYDMDEIGEPRGWKSTPDRRPSLMRIGRESPSFHDIMLDETKSPLIANRSMYRAHREMRIAVLEASKRFEELEAEREQARQVALAKKPPKELVSPTPSLTMKRTSRAYVPRARQESDQKALDDASHRGGRHRRGRRKTMSDISGMTKAS